MPNPKFKEAIFTCHMNDEGQWEFMIKWKDLPNFYLIHGLPPKKNITRLNCKTVTARKIEMQAHIRFSKNKEYYAVTLIEISKEPAKLWPPIRRTDFNQPDITNTNKVHKIFSERKNYGKLKSNDLLLPKDSRNAIETREVDNPSLSLNKLVYNLGSTEQPEIKLLKRFPRDKKRKIPEREFKIRFPQKSDYSKIIESFNQRNSDLLRQLGLHQNQIEVKLSKPLVIGLGENSVYETSICLHHIYGFPYIPGSAVKGLCLAWLRQEYKNMGQNTLPIWIQSLFGTENQKGLLTFQDAYPLEDINIQFDIINVHYQQYYSGNKWPDDSENPVPIYFPVVPAGQSFCFNFGLKTEANVELENLPKDLANKLNGQPKSVEIFVKKAIEKALEDWGIGAKTAVGYGKF